MHANAEVSAESELDAALCRLIEELTERIKLGERIDFDCVLAKHPQHSERLRRVLPTLELFAEVSASAAREAFATAPAHANFGPDYGVLGDFRILREIGRGGMGVVYEAEQISLERRVAVKVLPFAGVLDEQRLQRFKNEARAAAGLSHPRIVPIFAVGSDRGIHYYAMQYIQGQTLAEVIRELRPASGGRKSAGGTPLSAALTAGEDPGAMPNDENQVPARAGKEIRYPKSEIRNTSELTRRASATHPRTHVRGSPGSQGAPRSPARFRTIADWGAQIADALDYAHSVGVIHRDIKPGNLMLDKDGGVWITDFGLAQVETDAGLTISGDIVGTLRYMSPEQALGERRLVDQRTDVYSLGLALYELLTLQPAFGDADRRELLRRISVEDPVPPSRINPSIPVELETIIQKATEKDAAARYTTARDMADDLRRFLREQPIKARPATVRDRLRKWSRRNRGLLNASIAFGVVLTLALAAAGIWVDHERQQVKYEQKARAADQTIVAAANEDLRILHYVTTINLAERALNSGEFAEVRRLLQDCRPGEEEVDVRSFEWHYLWHAARYGSLAFGGHRGDVYCFQLAPDRHTAASGGHDGVRIWDFETGRELAHLKGHVADVNDLSFSPDGALLATASDDRSVKLWSTADWNEVHTIRHETDVVAVTFAPNGQLLATGERYPLAQHAGMNRVLLWDLGSWEPRSILKGPSVALGSMAFSADGNLLATGDSNGSARVWNIPEGTLRYSFPHPGATVNCVALANHRPLLATGGNDGIVRLWNTSDGTLESSLKAAAKSFDCVVFAPDDSAIAGGGSDLPIHVWESTPEGRYVRNQVIPNRGRIWSTAFADPATIVGTTREGGVHKWDRLKSAERYRIQFEGLDAPDFAISPDGKFLVTAADGLNVYDVADQSHMGQLAPSESCASAVAYSPDGKAVASGHESGDIVMYDPKTWQTRKVLHRSPSRIGWLQYLEGGEILMINGGQMFLEPVRSRVVPCPLLEFSPGDSFTFGPSGRGVSITRGRLVQAWNRGRKLRSLQLPLNGSWGAISADGLRFAHSATDGTIRIWNLDDEKPEFVFVTGKDAVIHMAFSADGRSLFGATTRDTSVRAWNVATGRELLTLATGLSEIRKIAASSDGRALVVSGIGSAGHGEVTIWQARSGQ